MPLSPTLTAGRPGYVRFLFLTCLAALAAPPVLLPPLPADSKVGAAISGGVAVRRLTFGYSAVRVIDVDLSAPGVRIEVVAEEVAVRSGKITGRARSLPDWLRKTGAVAGVNGGFFGATVAGEYKQVLGLLKRADRVRVAAPVYRSRSAGRRFAHAALGFAPSGEPRIGWVTSLDGFPGDLRSHPRPELTGEGTGWPVRQAVGCGPRLIRAGQVHVTDREEHLASPGALSRTFVGYGRTRSGESRLVLCAADSLEYRECARFLTDYFHKSHGLPCAEAMSLDGGGSTQAAWRQNGRIMADPDPGTAVPVALLVHRR